MRWLRHLFALPASTRFPDALLDRVATAIADGERRHTGEVRFAVEAGLAPGELWRGIDARERAERVFSRLRVWDTEQNNGVLIYLLLADHRIEIVADRAVQADAEWAQLCERIAAAMRERRYEEAALAAVAGAHAVLEARFARDAQTQDRNELPDRPARLD
jgi:uncharacterized membrane protein